MNTLLTPDKVPSYNDALSAGLLPHVPSNPPTPVTIGSVKVSIIGIISIFIVTFIAINISLNLSLPSWTLAVISGTAFILILATQQLAGRLRMKENAAGYSHVDEMVTTYGLNIKQIINKQNHAGPAGVRWSFLGLWKLNMDGSVNRSPSPGVLPIGYYPSPTKEGEFQYWTGARWLGKYLNKDRIPLGGRIHL